MFITIHAAAGALIGRQIANPALAFIIGLLSHFLLDIIPHGDKEMGKKFFGVDLKFLKKEDEFKIMALYGSLDALVMSIFLIFLYRNFDFAKTDNVSWAIIGGILPDILAITYKVTNFPGLKWFHILHHKIHYMVTNRLKSDLPFKLALPLQITFFAFLIYLLYH